MLAPSSDARMARACFALTVLLVAVGVAMEVGVAAGADGGPFTTAPGRIFNVFCYFTIQSNVLVGLACLLLAIRPNRTSAAFAWLRMTGLVSITITGVLYYALLADFGSLHGWHLAADIVVHTIVPVLSLVGWIAFGPRGLTAPHLAPLTIVYPACWLAFTLIRGPIADFYPYPFVDVDALGYPRVLLNSAMIGALVIGLAAGALRIDARLAHRRQPADGPADESADAPSESLQERLGRVAEWRERLFGAGPDERAQLLLDFGFTANDLGRVVPGSDHRHDGHSSMGSVSIASSRDRIYDLCALVCGCVANATYDEAGIVSWFRTPNEHLNQRCPLDVLRDGDFDRVRDAWELHAEIVAVDDRSLWAMPRGDRA